MLFLKGSFLEFYLQKYVLWRGSAQSSQQSQESQHYPDNQHGQCSSMIAYLDQSTDN